MNTVQIMIRGRSYTLRTDESEERMAEIAAALDKRIAEFSDAMKGRADAEVLTLVAFDLMEQSDDSTKEVAKTKQLLKESDEKNKQILIDNMNSAENELDQIAAANSHADNDLRVIEFEKQLDEQAMNAIKEAQKAAEQKQEEIQKLNAALEAQKEENQNLKSKLENFEKTFDDYSKTKEREIVGMQEEIEKLKLKLAEASDDGQMTLV